MIITYNYKKTDNIEIDIAKSCDDEKIALRISVIDENTVPYDDHKDDDYDGYKCNGDCRYCEIEPYCEPDYIVCKSSTRNCEACNFDEEECEDFVNFIDDDDMPN